MSQGHSSLDLLCVNTIRTLAIDMIEKAKSGHPGLPMGAAPMAYVLWQKHLRHNPSDPAWPDRDRFVLSGGHGSGLLYALLHLSGYALPLDEMRAFRQWASRTPGHPEAGWTPGVEATTGPLGQGCSNSVGMAMAERALAHRYNRAEHAVIDHFTYAIVTDGDLMEGVSAEAASLAGHLKLGKLIWLYDANDVTLDGPTSLAFSTEDVGKRFEAYGWQVLHVKDGDTDLACIDRTITEAKAETERPTLIIVKTTIGYGSPNKQGTSSAHGSPLGPQEVLLTKKNLGWESDQGFVIPAPAREHFRLWENRGKTLQQGWQSRFDAWAKAYPDLAREWTAAWSDTLPDGWDAALPSFKAGDDMATRQSAGKVLQAVAAAVPWLIGGDADLAASTLTTILGAGSFNGQDGSGRNIHFGVREHAMAAIANGFAYHRGLRPFVSTFFCFIDYMRPSMRLAAFSALPVIYVLTHDSVAVGEDGPTHQPVEQLMSLRVMPNVAVVRPADPNESAQAWRFAMNRRHGPVALVLTRQKLPVIDAEKYADAAGLHKGAYVLCDAPNGKPQAIVLATGSEVHLALAARETLAAEGIDVRVVSMPCWEAFAEQPQAYRDEVLPPHIRARVSVEAGVRFGWERWIGSEGTAIGIDRFGASAPAETIAKKLGLTTEAVVDAVRLAIKKS